MEIREVYSSTKEEFLAQYGSNHFKSVFWKDFKNYIKTVENYIETFILDYNIKKKLTTEERTGFLFLFMLEGFLFITGLTR